MFRAYTSELFRFDQLYRKFSELADKAEIGGWDVLKSLRKQVENVYSGWFLDDISLKWNGFLRVQGGLLDTWKIPYICNQYDFFNWYLIPILRESSRNRFFVIISDGFRYEAAEELMQDINGRYRLKTELASMLGVLPAYTALGMAALLPHKKLSFRDNSTDILVDSKPVGTLDLRSEILSHYHGTAIKADDLTAMSREQGREFVKPYRIIYIYHDQKNTKTYRPMCHKVKAIDILDNTINKKPTIQKLYNHE
jgi:hypothetical protein